MKQFQVSVVQKNCISISEADELQTFIKITSDGFQIKSISHENHKSFTSEYIIYQVSAEGKRSYTTDMLQVSPFLWYESVLLSSLSIFFSLHDAAQKPIRRRHAGVTNHPGITVVV